MHIEQQPDPLLLKAAPTQPGQVTLRGRFLWLYSTANVQVAGGGGGGGVCVCGGGASENTGEAEPPVHGTNQG